MYAVSCYNNLNPTSTTFGQWTGLLTLVPNYAYITDINPFIGGVKLSGFAQQNLSSNAIMEYRATSTTPSYPGGIYIHVYCAIGTSLTTLKISKFN